MEYNAYKITSSAKDQDQLLKNFQMMKAKGGNASILKTFQLEGKERFELWVDTSYSKHILAEELGKDLKTPESFTVGHPGRGRGW